MMKSKPLIIIAAIIAAFVGAWVGMNIFSSGLAQIIGLIGIALVGYLIYKGLRGNRRVATVGTIERTRILAETPAAARALVYREGFMGKLAGFDIAIDGVSYAQLKSPQSVAIDLPPGEHQLVVKVAGKNQPPLAFAVGAGETAVLRIGMGIAGPELSRDNSAQVHAKLAKIPMVRADNAPTEARTAATIVAS